MEAQTFELKTPYLKTGRSHNILAQTDLINMAIKYYYEGGENTLHTHPTEEHVFIALDGEATFYDKGAFFQDNTAQLNMRLPPAMKAVLSKLARQRTTDATTLARIWLAERLERELKTG